MRPPFFSKHHQIRPHGPEEQPTGNKISKDRFSILVCANAAGKKEQLLVIGKSKRLHSFRKYNLHLSLHVTYKSNKCGWMTTVIFTDFLNALNNKMKCQNGHNLFGQLFLVSTPSVIYIKLIFYAQNMTSKLQTMDQGVIANLKKNYTKCMLNMARMEATKASSITDIIKEIKIFDAILHAKVTWEGVEPQCIRCCFKQSGIMGPIELASTSPPFSPTSIDQENNDPEFDAYFQDLLDIPWDLYLAMDVR